MSLCTSTTSSVNQQSLDARWHCWTLYRPGKQVITHILQRRCRLHYQNLSIVYPNSPKAVALSVTYSMWTNRQPLTELMIVYYVNYLILGVLLLTRIFNAILRLGKFPLAWKSAKIITLSKVSKNQSELKSCRPVYLLLVFRKAFKKLLYRKILNLLPPTLLPEH